MKINKLILVLSVFAIIFVISSCNPEEIINNTISNEVTAKERLDSANAQAVRKYGANTNLVLILGKNVKPNGKTEIALIQTATNIDSVGAWLYIYKVGSDTSLKIYTPNPLPTASDCIELTAFFDPEDLLGLIQDTSARNIISGALNVILSTNVRITTSPSVLIDSDVSLDLANTTNPIIKFDEDFYPDTSSLNGNLFFSTGSNQTRNMMLIPTVGTLNLPQYIQDLTGFPPDMWIVNYKKTNASNQTENLILGTVVQSNQIMGISQLGLTSKVINISKYVSE